MKPPRGLTAEEAAIWAKVAATVTPIAGRTMPSAEQGATIPPAGKAPPVFTRPVKPKPSPVSPPRAAPPPPVAPTGRGLDSHWDRRFGRGAIEPDFTLDLHGHTLEAAHARLDAGLAQARAMDARVVLLIAGKDRGAPAADRGDSRGAIRSKLLDWLAAGPHGSVIAAIRKAHRRHGGEGALYLVLRRPRG
ncbi:MAG: Smr/MutS family protein [Tsuneonella suprasediminis]|nr:Smr/MutS family protein [Tsuneonella flava]UBS33048.1 Smr/MutS family protein [Altererythrobacter sp. N1]